MTELEERMKAVEAMLDEADALLKPIVITPPMDLLRSGRLMLTGG